MLGLKKIIGERSEMSCILQTASLYQRKHNHREAVKGHRTRKHFINTVRDEEAMNEIKDTIKDGTQEI